MFDEYPLPPIPRLKPLYKAVDRILTEKPGPLDLANLQFVLCAAHRVDGNLVANILNGCPVTGCPLPVRPLSHDDMSILANAFSKLFPILDTHAQRRMLQSLVDENIFSTIVSLPSSTLRTSVRIWREKQSLARVKQLSYGEVFSEILHEGYSAEALRLALKRYPEDCRARVELLAENPNLPQDMLPLLWEPDPMTVIDDPILLLKSPAIRDPDSLRRVFDRLKHRHEARFAFVQRGAEMIDGDLSSSDILDVSVAVYKIMQGQNNIDVLATHKNPLVRALYSANAGSIPNDLVVDLLLDSDPRVVNEIYARSDIAIEEAIFDTQDFDRKRDAKNVMIQREHRVPASPTRAQLADFFVDLTLSSIADEKIDNITRTMQSHTREEALSILDQLSNDGILACCRSGVEVPNSHGLSLRGNEIVLEAALAIKGGIRPMRASLLRTWEDLPATDDGAFPSHSILDAKLGRATISGLRGCRVATGRDLKTLGKTMGNCLSDYVARCHSGVETVVVFPDEARKDAYAVCLSKKNGAYAVDEVNARFNQHDNVPPAFYRGLDLFVDSLNYECGRLGHVFQVPQLGL